MPAVVAGHDEAGNYREGEIECRPVAGVEGARELRRYRLAEERALSRYRRQELTYEDGRNIADEEDAQAGRDSGGVPPHGHRAPLTELGANPQGGRTISRRSMIPGRGSQFEMVVTS